MRCLRKERTSPRSVRARLLAFARGGLAPAALVAALAVALAFALVSCAPRGPAQAGAPHASWYELSSTVFQSVGAADAAPQIPALPWTVQSRVTDMAFIADTLFCAVNGAGVAEVDPEPAGTLSFRYHYDAPIFAHRTLTTLVPRHGELLIHLYYNAILNDAKPEDLLLRGISLVTLLPGQKDYAFLIPPYQKKNPEWEAVGFAPISENEFDFEWKHTDSTETRFAYTRYRADLHLEAQSTRDAYMAALGVSVLSGPGVPAAYSSFFDECRSQVQGLASGTALHFKVRSRRMPLQRYFRSEAEQDAILVIHVLDEDGTLYALLPSGMILAQPSSGAPQTVALPSLPDGFRYTDFVKRGDLFIASWEETHFTQVGRAGVVTVRP